MKRVLPILLVSFLCILSCNPANQESGGTETDLLATCTTGNASNISYASATLEASFSVSGAQSVPLEAGFYYSDKDLSTLSFDHIEAAFEKVMAEGVTGDEGHFSVTVSTLEPATEYYYLAAIFANGSVFHGDVVSFTTAGAKEIVDLGLSVQWRAYNLGAEKPEEYGDYFAWGETASKEYFSWDNYKWCMDGDDSKIIKYCDSSQSSSWAGEGSPDNLTTLKLGDDAAHATLGGRWRMPTMEEMQALCDQCSWTWTQQNSVPGYLVQGNGNSIFFPVAGLKSGSEVRYDGIGGYYWTSSLLSDNPETAARSFDLRLRENFFSVSHELRRAGFTIRPVWVKEADWDPGQTNPDEPVVVIPVQSIRLNADKLTLVVGQSDELLATIEPENASDKTVAWSSSSQSVAMATPLPSVADNRKVRVDAHTVGTAIITAEVGGKAASCTVTVIPATIPVVSVDLNKESLTMVKGQTEQLVATITPTNASDQTITWTTSDAVIAKVDQTGLVTAMSEGEATISAEVDGKQATCNVTVKSAEVESITLNESSIVLSESGQFTLVATINPPEAADTPVEWGSDNVDVATVYGGIVTAQGIGEATIYAMAGDKQATCHVLVETEEDADLRAKLIKFFYDTDGPNWYNNENWCSDKPLIKWYGISKVSGDYWLSGRPITYEDAYFINLDHNGLSGEGDLSETPFVQAHFYDDDLSIKICRCEALLFCAFGDRISIDLSDCPNLEGWFIGRGYSHDESFCAVKSIIARNCTSLQGGFASGDPELSLEYLDLSGSSVVNINIYYAPKIKTIKLDKCSSLGGITLVETGIENLSFNDCPSLERIDFITSNNNLRSLSITNCAELKYLGVWDNPNLESFSISNCPSISQLDIMGNNLSSLNLPVCPNLTHLHVYKNKLTHFDLSLFPNLESLSCSENRIIQEITHEYDRLIFDHDQLYLYTWPPSPYSWYATNTYGWYYPGEPQKGYHGW